LPKAHCMPNRPIPQRPIPLLIHYVLARRWQFGVLFSTIVGASACAVAVQYGMKLIVDTMATSDRQSAAIWFPLGLFLTLIVIENIFWRLGGWIGCRCVVATGVDVRLDLFTHLTGHAMRYFSQHLSGSLGGRINQTAQAVGGIIGTMTWNILPPCIDFVGAVVVLSTVDVRMALALIAAVAFVAGSISLLGIRGRPLHIVYAERASRVGGEIVDVVSNIWTVKAFSAREHEHQRLEKELGIEADAHRRSWMQLEKTRVLHDICLSLIAGSMLVWAILLWRRGSITPGDVVLVSALTFRILHGSRDLAFALVGTLQQFGSIAETLRVIAQPHHVRDAEHAQPLLPRLGDIRLEDVVFSYPDGRRVFEGFSLHIPAGQCLGIVGPSGAGKSTLLTLIQRLDDVQGGRILIDGQCIAQVTQDSLREQIAVVPQEIALFHRSVMENIRYGRLDASDEEVITAAKMAYCDSFIQKLPQGYDTLVGERGVQLSGGQRQRLGIARAFLKGAPILILDEATSSLDTHSELEVQLALSELARARTVLTVAHRLSTVSNYDRIIVLENGRIVQDGTPAELRDSEGLFKSMWQLQADGFAGLNNDDVMPVRYKAAF